MVEESWSAAADTAVGGRVHSLLDRTVADVHPGRVGCFVFHVLR